MYKAVIFDLDGTLLDTLPSLAYACNSVLESLGHPQHELDDYRLMVGKGIPNLVWQMLPEACRETQHAEALKQYYISYEQNLFYELAPYPAIPDLLTSLHERGIKLAVLSNKVQEYSEQLIRSFFPGIFDCILGDSKDYPLKPDPASATAIAASLGLDNSEILFVGDSNVDMMTAKNAGMTACGVSWGFRSREELQAAGADHIVEKAEDILELLVK
jgi:phosphoglycolate phosphatase